VRIGLIVPSSNTVMEPDFHRHLGRGHIVSTARIFLEEVTRVAELRMLEEDLPRAVRLIKTTAPDAVVFGCTSAGALGTLRQDESISEMIARATGAKAITVLGAVLEELSAIQPRSLALFTPYIDDLTESVARVLGEAGYAPRRAHGMGIQSNLDIGRVSPGEIVSFVESRLDDVAPDCIFLSCTNWQAMEAISVLEARVGVPVVSSNQAALRVVQRAIKC